MPTGYDNRMCRHCLDPEISREAYAQVKKELLRIKKEDRTDNGAYAKRLLICEACEKISSGTCLACGCYVELRAAFKSGHCPKKKW